MLKENLKKDLKLLKETIEKDFENYSISKTIDHCNDFLNGYGEIRSEEVSEGFFRLVVYYRKSETLLTYFSSEKNLITCLTGYFGLEANAMEMNDGNTRGVGFFLPGEELVNTYFNKELSQEEKVKELYMKNLYYFIQEVLSELG